MVHLDGAATLCSLHQRALFLARGRYLGNHIDEWLDLDLRVDKWEIFALQLLLHALEVGGMRVALRAASEAHFVFICSSFLCVGLMNLRNI